MDVHSLLRRYAFRPKKSLGQNFLVDEAALKRIVAAAELTADDTILEIGPGLGTLTRLLAQTARKVVAVELDDRLMPILAEVLAPFSNVELVHGDILRLDPSILFGTSLGSEQRYKVVANIPYYITSSVIRHLLEGTTRPERIVLTIQLEVAERIASGPGDMSLLAVAVQFYGHPQIVGRIKAGSFYPAPAVDSAIVRIDVYHRRPINVADVDAFFSVVKAGFGERRKQLRNALSHGLHLPPSQVAHALQSAGVDSSRRAETLDLAEWAAVAHAVEALEGTSKGSEP